MDENKPVKYNFKDFKFKVVRRLPLNDRAYTRWGYRNSEPVANDFELEEILEIIRSGDIDSISTCIHHIKEVESGNTEEESIALCYDFDNLVSLCEYHHHKLHNEKGYHTREAIMRRREAAFNRTINKLFKK